MSASTARVVRVGGVEFGNRSSLAFISGPCQIESRVHALETAHTLREIERC